MRAYQQENGRFTDILDDKDSFLDGTSAEAQASFIMADAWRKIRRTEG